MDRRDWPAAYESMHRSTADNLRRARGEGSTFFRFGDGGPSCNPSRLSDRRLDDLAREHAERVVSRSINLHNEQAERPRVR